MTSKLKQTRSKASSSSIVSASVVGFDSDLTDEGESEVEVGDAHFGDKETTEHASVTWTPDNEFFFALVTFRVEDQLFRVPQYALEEKSEFFRNLLPCRSQTASKITSEDIDEPIFLEGIEKDAFRDLMRLLYPSPILSYPVNKLSLSLGKWDKLLHLARLWGLLTIRNLAIQELEATKLDEVDKLELALKYEITQWYADAYLGLVKRLQPLSVEEGTRLGLELSLKIGQVRERRLVRMVEREQKGTNAATTGNTTGLFGGGSVPFSLAPANGSNSSTAASKSSSTEILANLSGLASQNCSSSAGATSSSSRANFGAPPASAPLPNGTTLFGSSKTGVWPSNSGWGSSNTFQFNTGKTEDSLPHQANKLPAPKKLSEDEQLKQDIKETFGL